MKKKGLTHTHIVRAMSIGLATVLSMVPMTVYAADGDPDHSTGMDPLDDDHISQEKTTDQKEEIKAATEQTDKAYEAVEAVQTAAETKEISVDKPTADLQEAVADLEGYALEDIKEAQGDLQQADLAVSALEENLNNVDSETGRVTDAALEISTAASEAQTKNTEAQQAAAGAEEAVTSSEAAEYAAKAGEAANASDMAARTASDKLKEAAGALANADTNYQEAEKNAKLAEDKTDAALGELNEAAINAKTAADKADALKEAIDAIPETDEMLVSLGQEEADKQAEYTRLAGLADEAREAAELSDSLIITADSAVTTTLGDYNAAQDARSALNRPSLEAEAVLRSYDTTSDEKIRAAKELIQMVTGSNEEVTFDIRSKWFSYGSGADKRTFRVSVDENENVLVDEVVKGSGERLKVSQETFTDLSAAEQYAAEKRRQDLAVFYDVSRVWSDGTVTIHSYEKKQTLMSTSVYVYSNFVSSLGADFYTSYGVWVYRDRGGTLHEIFAYPKEEHRRDQFYYLDPEGNDIPLSQFQSKDCFPGICVESIKRDIAPGFHSLSVLEDRSQLILEADSLLESKKSAYDLAVSNAATARTDAETKQSLYTSAEQLASAAQSELNQVKQNIVDWYKQCYGDYKSKAEEAEKLAESAREAQKAVEEAGRMVAELQDTLDLDATAFSANRAELLVAKAQLEAAREVYASAEKKAKEAEDAARDALEAFRQATQRVLTLQAQENPSSGGSGETITPSPAPQTVTEDILVFEQEESEVLGATREQTGTEDATKQEDTAAVKEQPSAEETSEVVPETGTEKESQTEPAVSIEDGSENDPAIIEDEDVAQVTQTLQELTDGSQDTAFGSVIAVATALSGTLIGGSFLLFGKKKEEH
ncbi:MAG: hypothetical protein K5682_07165 [Lachnospiraceae bacterium]|nr:hypothetical protein [Lachnospiraceae bacterium]